MYKTPLTTLKSVKFRVRIGLDILSPLGLDKLGFAYKTFKYVNWGAVIHKQANNTPMKKFFIVLSGLFFLGTTSCTDEQVNALLGLTDSDRTAGLKSLLKIATDTSVTTVSKINGYMSDNLIKIPFPKEAAFVENTLRQYALGGLVDDFVLQLNRSAETAAITATPIFINAITGISFSDAAGIITGTDTAATQYMRQNTYQPLYNAFTPKVDSVLQVPLVAGVSAASSWNTITTEYNRIRAIPIIGQSLPPINTNLAAYTTEKALRGLFVKLSGHEARVRKTPALQVTAEIRKIFQKK